MLIQIQMNQKLIKKVLNMGGQKRVWPVWSQDSKIDCISGMNWWNELILCMMVQIEESKKLFQWFLGGPGQKWAWYVVHETLKSDE